MSRSNNEEMDFNIANVAKNCSRDSSRDNTTTRYSRDPSRESLRDNKSDIYPHSSEAPSDIPISRTLAKAIGSSCSSR